MQAVVPFRRNGFVERLARSRRSGGCCRDGDERERCCFGFDLRSREERGAKTNDTLKSRCHVMGLKHLLCWIKEGMFW